MIPPWALLWEQACNTASAGRSPPLISPGINHTLPVPRGERDESGGELEIMLMSRQVSPPLWLFQKLLILLVVSGLEIITSSNPCNTAWPAVQNGKFRVGRMEEGGMERLQRSECMYCICGLSRERFQPRPLILGVASMPIYYQKLEIKLKLKLICFSWKFM